MKQYSVDFRNAVVRMKTIKHHSYRYIVDELGTGSKSTFQRWIASHPFGRHSVRRAGKKSKCTDAIKCTIENIIEKSPFLTSQQIISLLKRSHDIDVDVTADTMSKWRRKMTYTKKYSVQSVVDNERVAHKRKEFHEAHQMTDQWDDVISIDETAVYAKCKHRYGFSKKGKRIQVAYTKGGYTRLSLLVAISKSGIVSFDVIKGAYTGAQVAEFIEKLPVPPGSRLLMDNASIHTTKEVKKVIEKMGFVGMYLPPYTPQWQPIEYFFSQFKHVLRQTALPLDSDSHATSSERIEALTERVVGALLFIDSSNDPFVARFEHCRRLVASNALVSSA